MAPTRTPAPEQSTSQGAEGAAPPLAGTDGAARRRATPVGPWTLRLIVLASGTATMALQMATVRLFAPWFGGSSLVWATTIGLSLLAMSLGYLLGGRLADRRTDLALLGRTLLAAGILITLIPLVAPQLLPHATFGIGDPGVAIVVGTAASFLALSFAPALLLGVTPPFAIRLAVASVEVGGSTAGRLYALSTVGSIIGTLLTSLVLVQAIGTRATLLGIGVLALAAGAIAVVRGGGGRAPSEAAAAAPHHLDSPKGDLARRAAPAADSIALPVAVAIVVFEGMAMMASEMSIARLVAPFFGASSIVWANIIAIVMGCIAVGSWLGGRMADRRPTLRGLVTLLAVTAVAVALLPFVASPVMRLSTGGIDDVAIGTVVGSFLATMAVLVVPVTLLGMVPPWTLRLAVPDVARAGRTSGVLYAASTGGALVGTFGSALWLIPTIGTRRTMLVFAALLAVVPLVLAVRGRVGSGAGMGVGNARVAIAGVPLLVVAGLLLAPTGLVKPLDDGRVLAEGESRYQFIQVVEDEGDGRRLLQLNEGWAVHSIWDPETVLTGGIWDHFLVLPSLLDGVADRDVDMLVIGSAAGTSTRAYGELRPEVDIEGVELDPEVTEVGREYFEMADDAKVTTADGRPFLRAADGERWNVIHVDAYRQPYIPFYLATEEFFRLAKSRLEPGGVLSINVGSAPADPRINEAVAATMREVFPVVARYRAEDYNEVIVATTDEDVDVEGLAERIRRSPAASQGGAYGELYESFAAGMRPVARDEDRAMTDDRAPVEWMTDRMIFGETG